MGKSRFMLRLTDEERDVLDYLSYTTRRSRTDILKKTLYEDHGDFDELAEEAREFFRRARLEFPRDTKPVRGDDA